MRCKETTKIEDMSGDMFAFDGWGVRKGVWGCGVQYLYIFSAPRAHGAEPRVSGARVAGLPWLVIGAHFEAALRDWMRSPLNSF